MPELGQHNVTSVTLNPTKGLTTDGGTVFYTRDIVIKHDEGESIKVSLFSDNALALCVPIDPESQLIAKEHNTRLVERMMELSDQLEEFKLEYTSIMQWIVDRDGSGGC